MLIKWLDNVPDSEFSLPFVQGMADRMMVSHAKYGLVRNAYPHKVSAIESLLVRLISYMGPKLFETAALNALSQYQQKGHRRPQGTGNTEYLMDAGNFAMIEFMVPSIGEAHYEATDSTGSPGRVWNSGELTAKPNVQPSWRYLKEGD